MSSTAAEIAHAAVDGTVTRRRWQRRLLTLSSLPRVFSGAGAGGSGGVEDDEGSRTDGKRRHGGMRWRAAAHAEAGWSRGKSAMMSAGGRDDER